MVTVRKISSRDQQKMKSRDYMLGSFFSSILSAITDPKDNKALQIKSDPWYVTTTKWKSRIETT